MKAEGEIELDAEPKDDRETQQKQRSKIFNKKCAKFNSKLQVR